VQLGKRDYFFTKGFVPLVNPILGLSILLFSLTKANAHVIYQNETEGTTAEIQ
jgi:hypothetical protein